MEKGLLVPTVFLTYSPGGSIINHHFIWRVPDSFNVDAAISENQQVIDAVRRELPVYHTRAMRRQFMDMYGKLMKGTSLYLLRDIYKELAGDASAARTTDESEVDKRLHEALENEDPDIIVDLHEGRAEGQTKYDIFWKKCEEFLQECTAVHKRRHGKTCFMARAISVHDLIDQVTSRCPEGTPIPSEAWVKYNFCPRNPRSKSTKHYTGRLNVKRHIQKRLYRKEHPDSHYCAALYRYLREFAVMYRDIAHFISIDDKHRIKVGEPGFPLLLSNVAEK